MRDILPLKHLRFEDKSINCNNKFYISFLSPEPMQQAERSTNLMASFCRKSCQHLERGVSSLRDMNVLFACYGKMTKTFQFSSGDTNVSLEYKIINYIYKTHNKLFDVRLKYRSCFRENYANSLTLFDILFHRSPCGLYFISLVYVNSQGNSFRCGWSHIFP